MPIHVIHHVHTETRDPGSDLCGERVQNMIWQLKFWHIEMSLALNSFIQKTILAIDALRTTEILISSTKALKARGP